MTVPMVTLDELTDGSGWPVERLRAEGITVGENWRGDPAITLEDARRFVQKTRAEAEKSRAEWDRFVRGCEDWMKGRTAAVNAAYVQAREDAPRHLSPGGVATFAEAAARKAGVEYERTVPRPEHDGVPGWGNNARLEFIREDELGPMGRIKQAVRERKERAGGPSLPATVR